MSRHTQLESAAEPVRPAIIHDIPALHELLQTYAEQGNLLPRTATEIVRHLRDFFVIDRCGTPIACGALEVFTEDLGEIRSLVVDEHHSGKGLGKLMVERIIAEARELGLRRLMALTYIPEFFQKLGFEIVLKESLPEKVWGVCVACYKFQRCDETAVLLKL